MTDRLLGAARIFASHYQIIICRDPEHVISDDENWNEDKSESGFAGTPSFRMVGTEADLNDHWVELVSSTDPPGADEWQRITCVDFETRDGAVHIMGPVDDQPSISTVVEPGEYAAYFAAQNLGVDQSSLGENDDATIPPLDDEALAARKDLEFYRIFLVRGRPERTGRIVDRFAPVSGSSRTAS